MTETKMNYEREERVFETYTDILPDTHEDYPINTFGIRCDDGWYNLILWALTEIKQINDENNAEIVVVDIKQKNGVLDLSYFINNKNLDNYVHIDTNIEKIIYRASSRSRYVCESCGKDSDVVNQNLPQLDKDKHRRPWCSGARADSKEDLESYLRFEGGVRRCEDCRNGINFVPFPDRERTVHVNELLRIVESKKRGFNVEERQ